ncbi:MAG TPA: hypothetical protein VGQ55_00070 [Pyrinomonadaceae bacterium]|nr:hypothetical protein [Pyrinomonadaceae bacterium]
MKTKFLLLTTMALLGTACGSVGGANVNVNANTGASANSNVATSLDPNKMPDGMSASPIPPSANSTPGIPAPGNVNVEPSPGGSPTPGIPDAANLNKPFKPGATPTPGIPSPEELRRQLQRSANGMPPPTKGDPAPPKPGLQKKP